MSVSSTYLIIDSASGLVVNAVVGQPSIEDGHDAVERAGAASDAWIGWTRGIDGTWSPPAPPPTPVPEVVSRLRAKAALLQAGLLDQANAAVAASNDTMLQLAWAEAAEFRRDNVYIAQLAQTLGLTSVQVDDLFVAAYQIQI
jgi:hypothetical protein